MDRDWFKKQLGHTKALARKEFKRRLETRREINDPVIIGVVKCFHPTQKAAGANAFKYDSSPSDSFRNERVLQFLDETSETWQTISWRKCLDILFSRDKNKITSSHRKTDIKNAFRTAIAFSARHAFIKERSLIKKHNETGCGALVAMI